MSAPGECKYRPGQVWEYKTRPSEPLSTLTILKVWVIPLGKIAVHIAIDDVHLTDLRGEEIAHTITHAPLFAEFLDQSVTELVKESGPIPDFAAEYADWEKDEGGIFIHTVAKIVTLIENAWPYGTPESDPYQ